jgi:cell division protein FtsW (lipid II flippase)
MHSPNRPLISSAAAGIGGIVLVLIGAPWWLTALAFTCFVLVLVVAVIQSVFPQESAHRLAWWRARWNHQQRRGIHRPAPRTTRQAATADPDAPDRHGE